MQNYRAGPVGHVGTRGVPRGAGGRITGGREEEGDATRGPGSTSTHLNFGYSQGQCGRTTRPSFLSPLRHFLRIVFFFSLFARPILSVFFSRLFDPSCPPRRDSYRIIASYRARTHALPRAVAKALFSFFPSADQLTILRNPN